MEIKLERFEKTDRYTTGRLSIGDMFQCFTVEDAERPIKIKGQTAIPAGRYQVIVNHSPRFDKCLPLLLNVPDFEGIRIHAGNDIEDTEGCILPNLVYLGEGVGTNSRLASEILYNIISNALAEGEAVFITIL